MSENNNGGGNSLLYMLAGFGLGAIVGSVAGLLFAPKEGKELREDVANKAKEVGGKAKELGGKARELKDKTGEWVNEQRNKRSSLSAAVDSSEEVGA